MPVAKILEDRLPPFIHSTHVDVSGRASMTYHFLKFFGTEEAALTSAGGICEEALMPVLFQMFHSTCSAAERPDKGKKTRISFTSVSPR